MKRFKSLSLKKKRTLAIAGIGLTVIAIGGTIAYNQTISIFNNNFQLDTGSFKAVDIVPVPSSDGWQPCQEYTKTAYVENEGETPRYVRTKMVDYWRIKNSTQTDHETSDLPMTWTDDNGTHKYAFYNLQNEDKWTLASDGYYYYNEPLAGGAATESLLKSVTFNCDANLAGDMTYSQDGLVAENTQSNYSDAEYHVYVIFEISDEPMLSRTRLYNLVASKTNGIDNNVDFANYSTVAENNGNGVNTLAAHANDEHPVYYYRGEINDNNVLLNGYCWKILRTTGTGGTKLVYAGVPTEENGVPVCNNTGAAVQLEGTIPYYEQNGDYMGGCYYSDYGLGIIGYMYSTRYNVRCEDYTAMYNITVGNDVRYENGQYTLIDTETGGIGPISTDIYQSRHYYCAEGGTSCEKVRYIYQVNSYQSGSSWTFQVRAVEFKDGGKIDDENGAYPNDQDSTAKRTVENWFANSGMTSIEDKLEDTIYCNDRTTYGGILDSKDSTISSTFNNKIYFSAGWRNTQSYRPSIDCAKKRDSFTKTESTTGNGKLRYKTGLVSSDELTLSGMTYCKVPDSGDMFLQAKGEDSWTMTPNYLDGDRLNYQFYWYYCHSATNAIANANASVRPVISMIYDTYVAGGTGTAADPYTLEW